MVDKARQTKGPPNGTLYSWRRYLDLYVGLVVEEVPYPEQVTKPGMKPPGGEAATWAVLPGHSHREPGALRLSQSLFLPPPIHLR